MPQTLEEFLRLSFWSRTSDDKPPEFMLTPDADRMVHGYVVSFTLKAGNLLDSDKRYTVSGNTVREEFACDST